MINNKNYLFRTYKETKNRKFVMTGEIKENIFLFLVQLDLKFLNIQSMESFSKLNAPHFRTLILDENPITTIKDFRKNSFKQFTTLSIVGTKLINESSICEFPNNFDRIALFSASFTEPSSKYGHSPVYFYQFAKIDTKELKYIFVNNHNLYGRSMMLQGQIYRKLLKFVLWEV